MRSTLVASPAALAPATAVATRAELEHHRERALALGATAGLIGRPQLFGLAVAGEEGVAHVLGVAVLMELGFLPGRATLGDVPLTTLLTV